MLLTMVPFTQLIVPMLVIFVGVGMFVGVVGSFASIRRFMKV